MEESDTTDLCQGSFMFSMIHCRVLLSIGTRASRSRNPERFILLRHWLGENYPCKRKKAM